MSSNLVPMLRRREFLAGSALLAAGALTTSRMAFAAMGASTDSRLIVVLLRGGLDGIAAVPPYGDPDFARLRGELAFAGEDGAFKLDHFFGLHPSLAFLHEAFTARELLIFHAVATPYRERSHFDGQDILENGYERAHVVSTGWLNRALAALPVSHAPQRKQLGVALSQNVPLTLRGPAEVASWSPGKLAGLDEETLSRIRDLYSGDALLSQRLSAALAAHSLLVAELGNAGGAQQGGRYTDVVGAAAGFLRSDAGPRVAMFDTLGWDTHANEGVARGGALATRLSALDEGLRGLKQQLGSTWRDTAVLVLTEFGRTAAFNGTRGTDHGTAGVAFLLGGAVKGGRVVADWPGLSASALYQGRDLKPTLDLRSIIKGVLAEQLLVPAAALDDAVFPESGSARALSGLIAS